MSHAEDIVAPRYKVTYLNENKLTNMSYLRRMLLFSRQIGAVVDQFDKKNTLFYFFSFNTAFLVLMRKNLQFIYEESDMLFDRFSSAFLQKLIIKLNRRIISKSGVTVLHQKVLLVFTTIAVFLRILFLFPIKLIKESLNCLS